LAAFAPYIPRNRLARKYAMIVFSLRCAKGHVFDEWFASGAEYEAKADTGELRCPECGDGHVAKAIMAPRVSSGTEKAAPTAPCATCGQEGGCPWAA
jgi:hypothetical protein